MSVRARSGVLLLVLAVVLSGCASARPRGEREVPVRTVLDNGVVVVAQEHRASEVVALQLWVKVGGRDEAPPELGLSHYLEHMLFKGTPTRPPGSIDVMIEGLGGQSNAYTSYDYTHYDVVLPAEHLRAGIELLADIAVNAAFVPEELDGEKKVVFEEMRLTEDNPEKYILRRLYELGYAPHPYGRVILGTEPLIQALDRAKLNAYYKKHYVPRNFVLVAVGAVSPSSVRAIAAETFGRLTGGAPERALVPPLVPVARGDRHVDVPRNEQQAYLGLAWRGVPTSHPDVYAVDLLNYVLGGDSPNTPSSRLFQLVRDRVVSSIESGYGAWERAGLVTINARLDAPNLARAESAIVGIIRRVRDQGVTEEERQRAIVTAEAAYAFDIETAEGLAKTYGQAETTWSLDDEVAYLGRLHNVTAADIQAAARKYFADDNYAIVRFVPQGGRR
ncbi:MAG: insulinase family protein [Candidatus Rokubacteria bacterium]|nr:insulinase family protein [Candidatus Rokubacteria bacterium]